MSRNKLLHAQIRRQNSGFTTLSVWSRGYYSGDLTVATEDVKKVMAALSIEAEHPALAQDEMGAQSPTGNRSTTPEERPS